MIPREGVESPGGDIRRATGIADIVIPREGVESLVTQKYLDKLITVSDPERGR